VALFGGYIGERSGIAKTSDIAVLIRLNTTASRGRLDAAGRVMVEVDSTGLAIAFFKAVLTSCLCCRTSATLCDLELATLSGLASVPSVSSVCCKGLRNCG